MKFTYRTLGIATLLTGLAMGSAVAGGTPREGDPQALAAQALVEARAALDAAARPDRPDDPRAQEILGRARRETDTAASLCEAGDHRHALRHLARAMHLLARLPDPRKGGVR